jgi:RNA polymerase sigma-70 factor (sigma-E family)
MGNAGDVAAFAEYAEARATTLFRTAFLMVGDHQLAQDLLQEALVKTLMAWPRLRDRNDLEAYTRRIIVTTSISWRRRRSFHERPVEALPERSGADLADTVVTHDAIVSALRTVPPRQRAAIVLRYYQDLTERQTAEAMGCSVGAVKSQVSEGLRKLRETLGPVFDDATTTDQEMRS